MFYIMSKWSINTYYIDMLDVAIRYNILKKILACVSTGVVCKYGILSLYGKCMRKIYNYIIPCRLLKKEITKNTDEDTKL